MLSSKYITAITAILVCVCLVGCGVIVYAAGMAGEQIPEYQTKLFGDEVLSIDIQVSAEDWQGLLDNPTAKEWVSADIVINGERFNTVGVRTKGNSSLSQVAGSDSDRYSLQFKFDEYVKGQNAYGLDAFCVNNMMGDATYMKDYISYDIMRYIGVEAPLTNYAAVTVNGESYCFGIALERYEKSYLDRAYNTSGGQLYSVKIQMGGRGDFEDARQDTAAANAAPPQDMPQDMLTEAPPEGGRGGFPGGGGGGMGGIGGMGGQSGGGSLLYTDDEISSYSAIFDNPVFAKASDKDKERVITAIKNLNAGTDLEKYFDVDEILRYFAAHNFVVNLDSYTSNMQQNYYIYERDGQITILPWDYGLAFGGFQSRDASSVVNFPIDTPVSGVSMEDRPLLSKLLEVPQYSEKYHEYLRQIAEGYFESGLFENTIAALDEKISEYVANDATAFFTYEQYKSSLPELAETGTLRAQSVLGQLDGSIPSTTSGQNADSSALVDASGIDLSAMGSMMGGGDRGGQNAQQGWQQGGESGQRGPGQGGGMPGGGLDRDVMRQAMEIIQAAEGEITDEIKASLSALGLTDEQILQFTQAQNGELPFRGQRARNGGGEPGGNPGENPAIPGQDSSAAQPEADSQYYIVIGAMLVLLTAAIIYIAHPRKNMLF